MTVKKTFTLLFMACTLSAQAIDINTIPDANANGRVGASMPYTRYDSEDAILGDGANLKSSPNIDRLNIASQASNRSYAALPNSGAFIEWTAVRSGRGVTMRFTIPDKTNGSLVMKVNENVVQTIKLDSKWMYQWFNNQTYSDKGSDNKDAKEDPIPGGIPCFAFDEVHFLLGKDNEIQKGDRIRIESTGDNGIEYGIDFIEVEKVGDPIPQPAGSINAKDYANIQDAFNDADGKTLYIPEGTYYYGSKLSLPNNATVVGAGMWYTTIYFTSSERSGGGFNGYNNNLDFSGVYINSNLTSRINQDAQYKCFAGIYNNVTIHDIWEEHFECGFWVADYNLNPQGSNNLKIINCRLRNNLADGVNFCQGTCTSTVYNCSVRNNGDDGLAMWNNNFNGARDENGNTFCYNTIDFDWRASGLAIFGGHNQRAYNNYICEGFLSGGIRLNTEYGGHKFGSNVKLENNIVVNCGTQLDIFGNPLASIIMEGDVHDVTFSNTQIYGSQWNVTKIDDNINVTVTNNAGASVPSLPEVDDPEPALGGPLDGITGYDLVIDGLAWKNQDGNTNLKQGDKVTFTAKILNKSGVNIPEGVLIGLDINITSIDGHTSLINNSYTGGLAAGEAVCLKTEWTATAGGHTVTATVDPRNFLPDEMDENNNSREKKLNVTAVDNQVNKDYTEVTGGYDLYVTDVYYENLTKWNRNGAIDAGDLIRFTAVAVNAGDQTTTPAGTKHGVQFQIDGKTDIITWCDSFKGEINGTLVSLAPHEFKELQANGGNKDGGTEINYWTAENGSHSVTAWIDDTNELKNEVNENNNKTTITLPTIPYYGIKYIDNPDQPDNLDGTTVEPEPEPTKVTVTIGSTEYATFYYDKPLDFTSVEGLKAYTATGMDYVPNNSDVLKLFISNIKSVPAETGLLLHGNAGTYTIPVGNSSGIYPNLFKGVLRDTYIYAEDGNYRNFVLYNGNKGIGFYPATNGTLSANKVYLPVNKSQVASAKAFVFNIDGEATAIEDVRTAQDTDSDIYHTLTGIRVIRPAKGVYIHNGRKVVIR